MTKTRPQTTDDGSEAHARVVAELTRVGLPATPEQIATLVPRYLRMRQLLKNLRSWLGQDSPEPAITFSASSSGNGVEPE